jgi:hypothetical protein
MADGKMHVDDETWLRGRGWALWTGLLALPYYKETSPIFATGLLQKSPASAGLFCECFRGGP